MAVDEKRRKKKSSYQSRELPILSQCTFLKEVKANESLFEVFVLKSPTFLKSEILTVEIFEEGRRHLSLKIPTKLILKAKSLF